MNGKCGPPSAASVASLVVDYLIEISPRYGCNLNSIPIFEVMMRLKKQDRETFENIIFKEWRLEDE